MARARTQAGVACVTEPRRARHLIHPIRSQILGACREPKGTSDIAKQFGITRQRAYYHLRCLLHDDLVEAVDQRSKRGFTETLYRSTAKAFLVAPQAEAAVAPLHSQADSDDLAAQLIAHTARTQADVATWHGEGKASAASIGVATEATIQLVSDAERKAFYHDLIHAWRALVERHPAAEAPRNGTRVVLAVYGQTGR